MVADFMKFVLLSLISIGLAAQPGDPAVLSEQARAAMASGRFDEAATVYRKLIAQMPNVGGLRMNLGLALFQARQYRAAATELKTALRLEPGLLPASMMLGICHGKLGEPLLAIPLLEKATKTMPENPVVVLELADAYYTVGRHPEAIRQFELLAGMQPKNPVAWRGLGVALTEYSQVLFGKLPAGGAEALTLLARSRLAADEPKAAFRLLRQALEKNPRFGPAHGYLAELYEKTGHADWAAAERALAGPGAGVFAEIVAKSEQALRAFGRLAELGPSVPLFETEADAARARGAHGETVAAWRKALALQPGAAALEKGLARALFVGRSYEEALPLLVKHGMEAEVGESLLETGKAAEAIPHLLKARGAGAALGRAYLAVDEPAKAIGPLRGALAGDTDGSVHFQLARALQRTGAGAQAREMDKVAAEIRARVAAQAEAVSAVEITRP
jgi:tetratricopeptide (TPR) repeat protein